MIETLTDLFNRRIDYLRISITDQCNLKCIYCMPEKGLKPFDRSEILTSDEIIRIVRIACKYGVRKVRLTGGEPLMRGDIIPLISGIKQTGIQDLSITTNGQRLAGMAMALKKAGVDRVNISLDTLIADRYRDMTRGGDIHRVWEAVSEAERAGLSPVKLTQRLTGDEAARLHQATRDVLGRWLARLRMERAGGFPEKVTAFREDFAVHGRYRQPCPRCGAPVQRIVHAENETNYCPRCQTGGQILSDRSLARLLKQDWPHTLEELEQKPGFGLRKAARARSGTRA